MNNILNKLREIQPTPPNPEELTSKIMRSIEFSGMRKQTLIQIAFNERTWNIFAGFRTAITAAALFLAGYFIYQQYEIKERLDAMENNITVSLIDQDKYNATSRKAKFQQLYLAQFASLSCNDAENKNTIVINRATLNFFLTTIRELEQENTSLRDIFKKQITDSIQYNNAYQQ